MDELLSLVSVVSPGKLRYADLIGQKDDQIQLLYKGLRKGQFSKEEEAKSFLFRDNKHRDRYFRRIKRGLRERLVNSVLCLHPDDHLNELQRAYIECHKNFSVSKLLLSQGKRESAVTLMEISIKQSLAYHFTDLSLSFARELQIHYSSIDPDKKKYGKYSEITKQSSKLNQLEEIAENYYCELKSHLNQFNKLDKKVIEKARSYSRELMRKIQDYKSYNFVLYAFNVKVMYFQMSDNHKEVVKTYREAIKHLNSLPFEPKGAIRSFLFKMIPAYINAKNFTKAGQTIDECLKLSAPGGHNWIVNHQYRIILGFHSNQFDLVYQTILRVKEQAFYRQTREHWTIYEAFAHFFILTGRIKKEVEKFRIGKFLNELPIFSKDKRGMNINILILQVLFLLQQEKYNKIIDRMDALKNYCSKYLREDNTFRSNCFIKMLNVVPSNDFTKAAVIRKSKVLHDKLLSKPIDISRQGSEAEIVPYETLWECVLELL